MSDGFQIDFPLTLNGQPVKLLVSCLGDGDTGGGLLYHDEKTWVCIDDVSTTGLFISDDELIRLLWAPNQVARSTSILHYDRNGVTRQIPVDALTDPHDVLWDGQQYVAVSSQLDSVLWITTKGTVCKRLQLAQGADCWHVNSLCLSDGALYATAFGRFEEPRGWVGHQREGTGILFRLDTGQDVLTGLCCPHTPRLEANRWIVCESMNSRLLAFDAGGSVARCAQLQNWVRGLALSDRYVFVGESVNRLLTDDVRGATVAVLDRETWNVLGRLQLPFREVYDLVLASPGLLDRVVRSPNARMTASCPPQM